MATAATPSFSEVSKHPKGLFILFFTEMWERFSYYGMRAILVLYLVAEAKEGAQGGLGWSESEALALYGWYTMLVYIASIPGGYIADKFTGQRKAVMIGGLLLVVGHTVMAFPGLTAFYAALALIIMGVGLLKPNISTLVGSLYRPGDPARDKGFTIFYIGINLGALLSSFIVGTVGEMIGWHYGFALAGIGMALGQVVYIRGQKHLKGVGELASKSTDIETVQAAQRPLSKTEKDRLIVMFVSFILVVTFWGAFEQAGGLMNLYTFNKIDRVVGGFEVPASWFQSLNPFFIIALGTIVANFWYAAKRRNKESSSIYKMAIGTMIMGTGFLFMVAASYEYDSTGSASMYWLVLAYLFHTIGELCASPVALSFITKLAPVKYASLMMGVYFAFTGFGNKVAGLVGELAADAGERAIFIGITVFTVAIGAAVLAFLKPLTRLAHGAEEDSATHPKEEAINAEFA